jgi:hypothetical protein
MMFVFAARILDYSYWYSRNTFVCHPFYIFQDVVLWIVESLPATKRVKFDISQHASHLHTYIL